MKRSVLVLALVVLGSMSLGCAAEQAAGPDGVSADDLVKGAGVSLSAVSDPALKINVKVMDGVKPSTKNKRFIRATVARGTKSFGIWCTGAGQFGQAGLEKIECGDGTQTVSNDDDESFSMAVVKKNGAYEIESVDYLGDGTFYGDWMRILKPDWEPQIGVESYLEHVVLTPAKGEGSAADPFPMLAEIGARLDGLLGESIPNDETRPLPTLAARFELSHKMELEVTLVLSKTGRITAVAKNQVSALKTPGDLASGLAAAAEIKARVLAQL